MLRLDRMLATATIALWAAAAAAEQNPAGEGAPVQPRPAPQGSVPVPQGSAPPAAQAQPVPQAPAAQQGTPATVLDTQDYESLLGKSVRSANGEELGRIIDVIIDKDGRPRAAIIDFGGFLGVGTRKIAVDWRALRFSSEGKPGRISLQLSRNQVRVSPEYKAGEPIVVLGPASPSAEADPAAAPQAQVPQAQAPQAQPQTAPAPVAPSAEKPAEKAPDK